MYRTRMARSLGSAENLLDGHVFQDGFLLAPHGGQLQHAEVLRHPSCQREQQRCHNGRAGYGPASGRQTHAQQTVNNDGKRARRSCQSSRCETAESDPIARQSISHGQDRHRTKTQRNHTETARQASTIRSQQQGKCRAGCRKENQREERGPNSTQWTGAA